MNQNITDDSFCGTMVNAYINTRGTKNAGDISMKCNQCDFASTGAGNLKRHLLVHAGEKLNKCNQCDYASSRKDQLLTHLKKHSGEKSNKCNQCDNASSRAGHLRTHLKHTH